MNAAEKNILHIAFALFMVGVVVRFLPWGVPAIELLDEPSKLEYSPPVKNRELESNGITDKVIDLGGGGDSREVLPKKLKKTSKAKKKEKIVHFPIQINQSGIDELCALKGVGPKLAEKIIAFREQFGPFKTPKDLEKVPGIGKKKLEGILEGIIFD